MTQASQRFSDNELRKLADATTKYLLIQEYSKNPIKRIDITKHVLKGVGRQYAQVIKLVQEKMKRCFGLELVELTDTQRYILVNKFSSETLSGILQPNEKLQSRNSLLMVILAYIFMAGGVVKELDMWAFLNKLRVPTEENTSIFGDVKKLITGEFVRQMYLEVSRILQTDPPLLEFRWGSRAEREVDKEEILNFVCQMHSNMDPERWTTQWKIVTQEKASRRTVIEEDDDDDDQDMSE